MNKYTVDLNTGTIIPYITDDEFIQGYKCFSQFLTAKTFAISLLEKKIEYLVKLDIKEVKNK